MMRRLLLASLLWLLSVPAWAADFAVVQCVLPTSDGGTVDCTSTGFGTPAGALFFGSYGTANGTAVSHAGFFIGAYDGTRQNSVATASEDGQADSDNRSFDCVDHGDGAQVTGNLLLGFVGNFNRLLFIFEAWNGLDDLQFEQIT